MGKLVFTPFAQNDPGDLWIGDFTGREHNLPGGAKVDASQFLAEDAVKVEVDTAGAAGNATAVPVIALSRAIPNGTTLHFGSKKFAKLTAGAAAGATSLTVEALPTALVAGDQAVYAGTLPKRIPSGTLLGRTIAERNAGTGFGPWVNTDEETYLLLFDIVDAADNPECELYRQGSLVKENFLPSWTDATIWTAEAKEEMRSLYETTQGVS